MAMATAKRPLLLAAALLALVAVAGQAADASRAISRAIRNQTALTPPPTVNQTTWNQTTWNQTGNQTYLADMPSPLSLWDLIKSRPELSTLTKLVKDAGLESLLNGTSSAAAVTMLMPVDAAFAALFADIGSGEADEFLANQTLPILLYHIHAGRLMQADVVPDMSILMKTGSNVTANVSWSGRTLMRDVAGRTADVLTWDLQAGPSVGHTIDSVLLPVGPSTINEALAWSGFSAFRQIAAAAGYGPYLNSTAANVTLLVPTDAAFEAALSELNLNMSTLLSNKTMCKYLVSPHILLGTFPWWKLQATQMTYLPTITSCATVFFEQDDYSTPMFVSGEGSVGQQSATLEAVDLVAGTRSFIQVLDRVLLPLSRWGKCRYLWG